MKYIRTKNGKIHISYNDYQGFEKLWVCWKRNTLADFYYVRRSSIVAQSDSIEELCDEFVLHYDYTTQTSIPIPWATYERRDDNWGKHKEKLISELKNTQRKAIVYGAIWTDKGLIYVAKMNEKGELELL